MIRSTLTVTDNVGDIGGFLDGYRDTAAQTFVGTVAQMRPQAMQALGITPGPVKRPIEWTSQKQRMAFFASDGFGKGIPFVRATHGPGNVQGSWYMKAMINGVDVSSKTSFVGLGSDLVMNAQIGNKSPASKYVYGSLAESNPGRFQQRFHINTGWLNGYREVKFWMNVLTVKYRENLRRAYRERAIAINTKRRAYTAPRRKI